MTMPLLADGRIAPFYYILKTDFMKARQVGPFAWAVYNCLCYHADQHHRAFPGYRLIGQECKMGQATVKRALDALVEAGLISITSHKTPEGWTQNAYTIARSATEAAAPLTRGGAPLRGGDCSADDEKPAPLGKHNKNYLEQESLEQESLSVAALPRQGSATPGPKRRKADESSPGFEQFWNAYPKRQGSNPRRAALAAWSARIREGVSPVEMIDGAERYAGFCDFTRKAGTQFVMQAARFLGPSKEYTEAWAVSGIAPETDAELWERLEAQEAANGDRE